MPLKKSFSLLGFSGKKARSLSLDSGTSASSSGNRRNSSPNPILPIVEESETEPTGEISYPGNPPSYSVIFGEDEPLSVIAEGTQLSAMVESNSDARQEDSGNNIPSRVDSEETAPTTERLSNTTHLNSKSFRAPETSAVPPSSLPSMEQVSPSVDTLSPHPNTTISAPLSSPPISPRALPPTPLTGSTGSQDIGDLVPPGPPPNPSQALRFFREAIIAGNIATVTRLIVLGTDVTSLPTLYLAAWHGHFDICKLLLSHDAPLEHKFDGDVSPLIAACYRGHLNIVKLLLRRGADVTEGSVAYGNCLSASCQSDSPDVVKQFLRKDRLVVHSLNAVWRDNGGPLHLACKNGNLEIAELLVAAGARIDLPAEPDKETPLCFACVKRLTNLNLISFLLDHHASVDGADSESSSPLGYACRAGNLSLAKLLLKRGANVNDHSHSRELPLYIACQERNLGLVELLIEYRADLNTKCKDKTPIEIACELGHRDIIASLLQHGAILSPRSTVHLPVLERAVKDGDDVLQKLLRKGSTSTSSNSALLDPIQVPLPGPSSSPTIRPVSFSSTSTSPPIGFKPTSTSPPLPESLASPSTSHLSRPRRPTSAKALELLQGAVHVGNVVAAERLLTQGTDISLEPMLYTAALNGDLAMCELLLAHDTPLEQTQNGVTPLIVASLHGHIQVVQLLLKHGASVAAVSSSHGNCLNAACTSGNVELVRLLLWELNLDVNLCPSSVTMMPLCFACSLPESASSLDLVSLFLDKGADVNCRKGKTSPLGMACTENNVPLVKLLISRGADINEDLAFPRRDLPLQIACRKGNLDLVKLLLEFGANPNAICSGPPPLRLACTQGQHDIVQCLLEKEARVDPTLLSEYEPVLLRAFQASTHRVDTVDGQPALIISTSPTVRRRASKPSFDMGSLREAVSDGNLATVQRLLSLATDISSEPLLCLAAWNGHISICEVLLEHHAPLEYKDDNDMTPLLAASVQGYTTIVQLLLDQGADAEYRSATHGSCIEAACRTGRPELVAPFLEREKIDLNAPLGARDGPLHVACSAGHYALARLLVKHGADVNLPVGLEKKQPLFLACAAPEPNLDIIAFLLDKGADVQTAPSPNSPLNEACFSGNIPLIELLLSRGAKINDRSRSQELPLHIATVRGNIDLLRLLLRKGADPNEANGGDTALSLACRSEIALPNLEIVRCLLENGAKVLPHATAHTTAFERALQTGDTNLISLFLKQGAFSEDLLRKSCTNGDLKMVRTVLENAIAIPNSLLTKLLLTIASPQENSALVELLVRHGADVTAEHSGVTPLESACRKGSYDMVKCLLQVGAKLAPRSTSHIPIFEHALRDSNQSLVDLFIHMGADSTSLLRTVLKENDVEMAEEIFEKGATISGSSATEFFLQVCSSPLLSARNDSFPLLKRLISLGADPNIKGTLHTACARGQIQLVEFLLASGAQCNTLHLGNTALYMASFAGHLKIVELLLSKGALVDRGTSTPLHATCVTGKGTIAAVLLENDATIKAQDIRAACENSSVDVLDRLLRISPGLVKNDLLLFACQRGYVDVVLCLIRNGQMIENALQTACACANVEIVRALLEKQAVTKSGLQTSLEVACTLRDDQGLASGIVLLLLGHPMSNVNPSSSGQARPLTIASENGLVGVVKLLLLGGAHVDADNDAAFLAACREGHLPVLKILASHGASSTSKVALRLAVSSGHADIIEWFWLNGSDVECPHPNLGTLLHLACSDGHLEASRTLVNCGAAINTMHKELGTPLMCASRASNVALVQYLVDDCAADINVRSPENETAIEVAASDGQTQNVELLLSRGAEVGDSLKIALEMGYENVAKLVQRQISSI